MGFGRRAPRGAAREEERQKGGVVPADEPATFLPRGLDLGPSGPARAGCGDTDAGETRAGPARDRVGPVLLEARAPSSGVPTPTDPIVLRFDEPVRAGSGAIRLVGEEETIRIPTRDAERVVIKGEVVRIGLDRALEPGSSYTLEFGRKALRDLSGNALQPVRSELLPVIEVAAPGGPGPAPASWTILVYMAADNDLERYALLDLAEMERVALPPSVNLVALVDRSPWYVAGPGDFTDTRRGPVRPDGDPTRVGERLDSIGERNTGDPSTLAEFLDWATATFPAERYGLVVWNHGGGLAGAAWDDSSRSDRLTLREMREAIEASRIGRLDLLGFDACLMAMAEVAGEFSGVAEVMVASQELEPAEGWPYDRILAALLDRPSLEPEGLAAAIVRAYAERFSGARDITLSALDLRAMPGLEGALDELASAVARTADPVELQMIAQAVEASRSFPRDGSYPYRDLGEFLEAIDTRIDDPAIDAAARRALAALDGVVIAESGTVGRASGLAIHLPDAGEPAWPGYDPAHLALLGRTDWESLVDRLVALG